MGIEELNDKALREIAGISQHELARRFADAGYKCSQGMISQIEAGKAPPLPGYRVALESVIGGPRTEPVAVCLTCNKPHSLDNCHGKVGELVILGHDEAIVTVNQPVELIPVGPHRPPRDRHSVSMEAPDFMRINSARIELGVSWLELLERGVELSRRSAYYQPSNGGDRWP